MAGFLSPSASLWPCCPFIRWHGGGRAFPGKPARTPETLVGRPVRNLFHNYFSTIVVSGCPFSKTPNVTALKGFSGSGLLA